MMIRVSILMCALFVSVANAKSSEPTSQQINSTIRKAHAEVMNRHFMDIRNLANKHKLARPFFAEALGVDDSSDFLKGIAPDEPTPKVTIVPDGIVVEENNGKRVSVTLGKVFGSADVKILAPGKAKSAWMRELSVLPTADAGVWDWVGRGYHWMGEGTLGMKRVGNDLVDMSAAERIARFAKGSAYFTAQGAAAGCLIGMHAADDPVLPACAQGAVGVASLALGYTTIAFGASAGLIAGMNAWDKVPPQAKLKLLKGAQILAGVGMAGLVGHGADSLLKSDGARLVCDSKDSFRLVDLSLSEKPQVLISASANKFSFGSSSFSEQIKRDPEALKSHLKTMEKYKSFDDQTLAVLVDGISNDLKRYSEKCKNHGRGYTETYRIESDKPAIEAGKENKPTVTK